MDKNDLNPYATAWKSENEAADYLGVSLQKLRILCDLSHISAFKLSGKRYFTESNLKNYLELSNNVLHLSSKTK